MKEWVTNQPQRDSQHISVSRVYEGRVGGLFHICAQGLFSDFDHFTCPAQFHFHTVSRKRLLCLVSDRRHVFCPPALRGYMTHRHWSLFWWCNLHWLTFGWELFFITLGYFTHAGTVLPVISFSWRTNLSFQTSSHLFRPLVISISCISWLKQFSSYLIS